MDHQAFAQLLGNYGEFLGAIAVVATLGYLAVQVRQSNRLARRHEMNMGNDQMTRLRLAIAVDRELAELIARGYREPSSLDAVDKNRFDAFLLSFMRLNFQAWDRARTGLLDMREWDIARDYTGQLLSTPGGSVWWTENRDGFIDEFRGVIDESIREHTGSE